jgi:TPR repeat protein
MNLKDVTIDIENVTQSGQQTPGTSSSLMEREQERVASLPAQRPTAASTDQGDATTQFNLGNKYREGHGVTKDYGEAVKSYRKAADQGNANAQCNLGDMYNYGQGVTKDYGEAVKWYRKAADQGNAAAQRNMGIMYFTGQGVARDYREAVNWFQKATDNGDEWAKEQLWNLRRRE